MKVKDGFILRAMNDKNIVVAVGDRAAEFNGLITLNSTATFLWKGLESGLDREQLAQSLVSEYAGVDMSNALADVDAFTDKLRTAGILDE